MTDSGRPEPVAWWCNDKSHIADEHPYQCYWTSKDEESTCDPSNHTPLYPPSVVAGELRKLRSWIENNDPLSASDIYKEAARRAAVWESK